MANQLADFPWPLTPDPSHDLAHQHQGGENVKTIARIILVILFVRLMGVGFLVMVAIIWGLMVVAGWDKE